MQPLRILKILGLVSAVGLISSIAFGATITGKVTGPDGAPFRAAFVQARNAKTRVTVIVLSGNDGKYRVENLPAGDYQVLAKAVGYRSDPKSGIVLAANQNATFDWTMQKQMVHWDEIPIIQGIDLFPEGPGKDKFARCGSSCHGFQQFINVRRDENGWREVLKDQMSTRIGGGVVYGTIKNDQDVNELAAYASKIFGTGPGALPESPADLPGYVDWMKQFSDDALKIVYVHVRNAAGPHDLGREPGQGRQHLVPVFRDGEWRRPVESGNGRAAGIFVGEPVAPSRHALGADDSRWSFGVGRGRGWNARESRRQVRQADQVQRAGQVDEHGARRSQWNLVGFRRPIFLPLRSQDWNLHGSERRSQHVRRKSRQGRQHLV